MIYCGYMYECDIVPNGFIDAVVKIAASKNLELCTDEDEIAGKHTSICVYKDGLFLGKLRWPYKEEPATVDEPVVEELLKQYPQNELVFIANPPGFCVYCGTEKKEWVAIKCKCGVFDPPTRSTLENAPGECEVA